MIVNIQWLQDRRIPRISLVLTNSAPVFGACVLLTLGAMNLISQANNRVFPSLSDDALQASFPSISEDSHLPSVSAGLM
jgi:hypothetical protein